MREFVAFSGEDIYYRFRRDASWRESLVRYIDYQRGNWFEEVAVDGVLNTAEWLFIY